jgi:hypothetical protein
MTIPNRKYHTTELSFYFILCFRIRYDLQNSIHLKGKLEVKVVPVIN